MLVLRGQNKLFLHRCPMLLKYPPKRENWNIRWGGGDIFVRERESVPIQPTQKHSLVFDPSFQLSIPSTKILIPKILSIQRRFHLFCVRPNFPRIHNTLAFYFPLYLAHKNMTKHRLTKNRRCWLWPCGCLLLLVLGCLNGPEAVLGRIKAVDICDYFRFD